MKQRDSCTGNPDRQYCIAIKDKRLWWPNQQARKQAWHYKNPPNRASPPFHLSLLRAAIMAFYSKFFSSFGILLVLSSQAMYLWYHFFILLINRMEIIWFNVGHDRWSGSMVWSSNFRISAGNFYLCNWFFLSLLRFLDLIWNP